MVVDWTQLTLSTRERVGDPPLRSKCSSNGESRKGVSVVGLSKTNDPKRLSAGGLGSPACNSELIN